MEIVFELLAQVVFGLILMGICALGGRGFVSIFRNDGEAGKRCLATCRYVPMGTLVGRISN